MGVTEPTKVVSRGSSDRGSALFRRVRNLSLWKLIRLSPVSNRVQYDIPAKDVIAQPVVSRPDAPLSLSRFQARQLFDIVPTRIVIRVLREDVKKSGENAKQPGVAPGNSSCISLKCRGGEGSIDGRHGSEKSALLHSRLLQFFEECRCGAHLALAVALVTLSDLCFQCGILQFKVVFKFRNAQNTSNGNPVLLQNEVFVIEVSPTDDLAEVNAGFGDCDMVNHGFGFYCHEEEPLCSID